MIDVFKTGKNTTEIRSKGDVPFITFKNLDEIDFVANGFTTRLGGVSKEHLYSMNLSFTRGDLDENVYKNYEIISDAIGFDMEKIVMSNQTHTTNVKRVYMKDAGRGMHGKERFEDIDGLVTNEKGLVLATFYADCVPLYFVDPVNKAIGLSHSGWRGTVNRMGKVTLEKMAEEFGTKPGDVICAIGPSICMECYEVSKDVADEFVKEFAVSDIPVISDEELNELKNDNNLDNRIFNGDKILIDKGNGKYQLNLWEANKRVLLDAGIKEENLSITDICTCHNPDVLYSHRASMGKRGNLAAFLTIKD